MPLPLVAIPLAAAGTQLVKGIAQFAGDRAQAAGMMPDEYKRQLEDLNRRRAAGQMGLLESERSQLEQEGQMRRGAVMADAQQRQLQAAQMASGQRAGTGRDLFLAELGTQQMQAQMQEEQAREIAQMDRAERIKNEQLAMQLAQREASAEAARRQAGARLVGNIVGAGAQAGLGIAGVQAFQNAEQALLAATAGSEAARTAQRQLAGAQAAMGMAAALGGTPMPVPMTTAQPRAVPPGDARSLAELQAFEQRERLRRFEERQRMLDASLSPSTYAGMV
jgi:hypothetical protein